METDSDSNSLTQLLITGQTEEGELSDLDQDPTATDVDQALSEEQTYWKIICGIRSYMGWIHIPDVDSAMSSAEDNPFEN